MHPVDICYPGLRILDLADDLDRNRLRFLFCSNEQINNPDVLEGEERFQNYQDYAPLPGRLILERALSNSQGRIRARWAIVEFDYIDRDQNILYYQLYARAFRDHPRRNIRIHFLKNIEDCDHKVHDFNCRLLLNEDFLKDYYLGFCVLSPTYPRIVGRTILPPPDGDDVWHFIPCLTSFPVNLGGAHFEAKGTAFMQQDGRVAACASSAVWMSTEALARRPGFDMRTCSPAEITQLATRFSLPPAGRAVAPGLSLSQILWALSELGYEPRRYAVHDEKEAHAALYSYVESGIPVILVIHLPNQNPDEHHAVTVVGHTYDQHEKPKPLDNSAELSASAWCPQFIIHDDQMGPYLKVSLAPTFGLDQDRTPKLIIDTSNLPGTIDEKKEIEKWYEGARLLCIVAPLPPRTAIGFQEAATKGETLISRAFDIYQKSLKIEIPKSPVFRTYLISSNEYRRRLVPETIDSNKKLTGLSEELAALYRGSNYPRYIWVTELCSFEQRNGNSPEDIRIIADVTLDPSSAVRPLDFITLHIPHAFMRMPPQSTNAVDALHSPCAYIQDDPPYPPLLRMKTGTSPV